MASKKSSCGGAMFSSAVGGYRKQDVNDYIVSMDTQHAEAIAALEEKLESAEQSLELTKTELEARIAEIVALQAKIEQMKAEMSEHEEAHSKKLAEVESRCESAVAEKQIECEGKLAEAKDRETELLAEIEQKISCIKELEGVIEELKETLAQTEARLAIVEADVESSEKNDEESAIATSELEELRRKAALYDELGASLGSSLTNATIAAHNLLVAARNEADSIRRQAETELEIAREAIRQSAVEAVDDICNIIGNATVEELDRMLESLDDARDSASEVADSIARKSWESKAAITYVKTTLEAEIGRRLSMIGYTPDSLLASLRETDKDAQSSAVPEADSTKEDSSDSDDTGESAANEPVVRGSEEFSVGVGTTPSVATENKSAPKTRRAANSGKRRSIFSMLVSRPAKRSKKK